MIFKYYNQPHNSTVKMGIINPILQMRTETEKLKEFPKIIMLGNGGTRIKLKFIQLWLFLDFSAERNSLYLPTKSRATFDAEWILNE